MLPQDGLARPATTPFSRLGEKSRVEGKVCSQLSPEQDAPGIPAQQLPLRPAGQAGYRASSLQCRPGFHTRSRQPLEQKE